MKYFTILHKCCCYSCKQFQSTFTPLAIRICHVLRQKTIRFRVLSVLGRHEVPASSCTFRWHASSPLAHQHYPSHSPDPPCRPHPKKERRTNTPKISHQSDPQQAQVRQSSASYDCGKRAG
ncbi:hypothetical protein BCR34DRAFT_564064 [Clohesyomyces aquaticus]|uniref:Uncharacterized protein n=1 Tax=Clohesyomyces aquaticus TaxID=1231657 RepID=A0A1Y1ZPR1_9PLEO|nr:hypothetical protein BCR34DRAFT_564064 [Clohesyomyces aquaticus]